MTAHAAGGALLDGLIGGTEETTTGLVRLRRLEEQGELRCPVLAVNEARTERALNDRHGTGQSALDGIIRASNVLLAGQTVVVLGYGWAGQGVAERARGAGAAVIVCEVDPLRALEARMAGYEVMPALEAAERGDVFITVTGSRRVLRREHFERMKDGALLANAGHFDVELDLDELRELATGGVRAGAAAGRAVRARRRPAAEPARARPRRQPGRRRGASGRRDGRVVRASGAVRRGAGAARRDATLPACTPVPAAIDREVGRLKLAALGVEIDEPTAEQDALPRVVGLSRRRALRLSRITAASEASRHASGPHAAPRGGIDLGGTKIEAVDRRRAQQRARLRASPDADQGRARRRSPGRWPRRSPRPPSRPGSRPPRCVASASARRA